MLDHDFPSLAEGVAIPHAIYDIERNKTFVNIGSSRDTCKFSCDSIRHWWNHYGKRYDPNANSILMLMDGGGRTHLDIILPGKMLMIGVS